MTKLWHSVSTYIKPLWHKNPQQHCSAEKHVCCCCWSHSLIRGVLIQSCLARAKNFTNYVFCLPQFSGVIKNIENCCAILTPVCLSIIIKIINFIESKIEFSKFCSYGTTIFNILDNTTELWMTKYIMGELFSSSGATLYKNPSDQIVKSMVLGKMWFFCFVHKIN